MSLAIVQAEDQKHPELLQTNINATCFTLIANVIATLTAGGHQAAHVAKTAGEGQYTPPGFEPRPITGLDGQTYTCTGVSHDAIWCDGQQFDCVGQGNDSPFPIYNPDGSRIVGIPAWNQIPSSNWRPQNPPITVETHHVPTVPSYESLGGDAFFRANVGVPLEADMTSVGQALNEGSSVWFSRTVYDCIVARFYDPKADLIPICWRHRNEWRAILGLPPI